MHPRRVRERALALIEQGLNDCEVSRRIGVPRTTVRDWRRPRYVRIPPSAFCHRCWGESKRMHFTSGDYAELLGLYLGDGCISRGPRTFTLRLFLDAKSSGIIDDTKVLLERCLPDNPVGLFRSRRENMVVVTVHSNHFPCLFPQFAGGKKHERRIALDGWQIQHLEQAPWRFINGCIRSDGCAFVNRTGPYSYLSYHFANKSEDIIDLFTKACHLVGVEYRQNCCRGKFSVRINRRASVELMLANVGLKT
jgi:Homeodomain-like domain-containing protein